MMDDQSDKYIQQVSSESNEEIQSDTKGKSSKKKKKHKHKHKHKHGAEKSKHGSEKSKHKHKRKKHRDESADMEDGEFPERKRPRVEYDGEDATDALDESDLERLEAARAALRAELNGAHYDANAEEQDQAASGQELGKSEYYEEAEDASYHKSQGKNSNFAEETDTYQQDIGLAITIKGDSRDESRLVSDRPRKSRKFEEEKQRDVKDKHKNASGNASGSFGLIANYGSHENSGSEEEGEIQNDLNDDLLEYAMHEDESASRGRREHSKGSKDGTLKSFEKEYDDIRRRREKEMERKKEKKEKSKKSENVKKTKRKTKKSRKMIQTCKRTVIWEN